MRTKPLGSTCRKKRRKNSVAAERHLALLATVGVILPAESDALLIEGQQAVIGNGHAMGVAAEIAQHLHGTAEGGLGIDDPVVAMQAAEEFCELLWIGESSSRAGTAVASLRRWRRFRPARNLPRKTRLRTFTGKKKG